MRALLIEDDTDIAGNICDFLDREGVVVDIAYDGSDGLHIARQNRHDIILLDVNLPRMDGFALCRSLRETYGVHTPVIFITARGDLTDKLEGFDAGGWDYLVKPFPLSELWARIRAMSLRLDTPDALAVGQLRFQPHRRRLSVNDQVVHMPNIVFRILTALMAAYPDTLSRDALISSIWGEEEPDSSPLRSHMSDLRTRLRTLGAGVEIQSIRGVGYMLKDLEQQS